MDYTVWMKDEYEEAWRPQECGDLGAAKRKVLEAAKEGKEVRMTAEVTFELQLKVGEPGAEVKKTKTKVKPPAGETTQEEEKVEADKDKPEQN